jgi:hypothetical protein
MLCHHFCSGTESSADIQTTHVPSLLFGHRKHCQYSTIVTSVRIQKALPILNSSSLFGYRKLCRYLSSRECCLLCSGTESSADIQVTESISPLFGYRYLCRYSSIRECCLLYSGADISADIQVAESVVSSIRVQISLPIFKQQRVLSPLFGYRYLCRYLSNGECCLLYSDIESSADIQTTLCRHLCSGKESSAEIQTTQLSPLLFGYR